MKKEDPQIPLFISYDRSSGKRSRIERIYTDIKIARNTKINHIIVSFVDYYNAIFNYRPPSKTKIVKDSRYFDNSLSRNPEFASTTSHFKTHKKTVTLQQLTDGNTENLVLKRMQGHFLKLPPLRKMLVYQD